METRDYSSIYDIQNLILNQIAPNCFDIDKVSLMNTGLYGLITGTMSTVIEDNMRTTSRYITEMIRGQSRLPQFIYANASNYGITDTFAKCARCSALLFIKESDILNKGTKSGRYSYYTIDSDMVVYVEDIPFSVPYNIKIRSTYYNGQYNHHCFYDKTFNNDAADKEPLPYIKSAKTRISGGNETYLALNVTLYQYNRRKVSENIIMNSTLNIAYIDVPFNDKLCNIEVLYGTNDDNKKQLIKLVKNAPPVVKPFIYHELLDEQTLRLSFSNDDRYFTPDFNSEVDIYLYESNGKDGNFQQYTGDDVYVVSKSEDPTLAYNNEVAMYCSIVGDSGGGRDSYSLEDIRIMTDERQITVNSITTDNDLDQYFKTHYTPMYNTYAKTIKIRDDVVDRIFSIYTRLIDEDNNIYPTNMVNLEIRLNDSSNISKTDDKIVLKSGTRIGYKDDTTLDECVILSDDIEKQEIEYTTIGLMVVDKSPSSVAFYMNSISKSVILDYTYVNDDSMYQFIVKNLSIERNAALNQDSYLIRALIIPTDLSVVNDAIEESPDDYTGDMFAENDDTDAEEVDENVFNISKISLYIYIKTNSGHYIKLDYNADESGPDNGYIFQCEIRTNDIMSGHNIELFGLTSCETQTVSECFTAMKNPPMKFLLFYDEKDSSPLHDYMDIIPETNGLTLCNIYEPQENELYFAYPLNLIQPVVEFYPDSTPDGFKIEISGTPVVGRDFILKDGNLSKLLSRINSQHEFLQDTMITSNYSIHMKFYNTYGRSRIFTVTNGGLLNHVNTKIDLTIAINDGVEPSECIDDIKLTIKEYIEGINNVGTSGTNNIKVSSLINILTTKFSNEINYIIFNSINGYSSDIQTITMEYDLSESKNLDRIPEFLTLSVDDISITIK